MVFIFGILEVFIKLSEENYLNKILMNSEKKHYLSDSLLCMLKPINTTDYIIVINIWESWCAPCIKEIPELNRLKADFNNRKVHFISLTSSSQAECDKVLSQRKLIFSYSLLYERKDLISKIDSVYYADQPIRTVVPKHIIIDNKGCIISFYEGSSPENILKMKLYLERYAPYKLSI